MEIIDRDGKRRDVTKEEIEAIEREKTWRLELWEAIKERYPPDKVDLGFLDAKKIRPQRAFARGVFRDSVAVAKRTGLEFELTVSVFQKGEERPYPDEIGNDGASYCAPTSEESARLANKTNDARDIVATLNCKEFQIPIFYIYKPEKTSVDREVRIGYVKHWNDESFWIQFGEKPGDPAFWDPNVPDDTPLQHEKAERTRGNAHPLIRDSRFRRLVFDRYGEKCAVCNVSLPNLLAACHIVPAKNESNDDVINGLVLCHNHHSAYDALQFTIRPEDYQLDFKSKPSQADLQIEVKEMSTKTNMKPCKESLQSHYDDFKNQMGR